MNVTQEMIHNEKRKAAIIPAMRAYFDKRVEAAPDEATRAKAVTMIADFMAKAEAQPAEFYGDCKDMVVAMRKLQAL